MKNQFPEAFCLRLAVWCSVLLVLALLPGCACGPAAHHGKAAERTAFNVRAYGARGNGTDVDSVAINRAIRAASRAGGGTVFVPAGIYLSGSIHLTNNINLHLDAGAVLRAAPQNLNAYDEPEKWEGTAYQDGGHTYFHNSLIWGENLTNVSITGPGLIDGSNLSSGDGQQDRASGFSNWQNPGAVRTNVTLARLGNKAIASATAKAVEGALRVSHGFRTRLSQRFVIQNKNRTGTASLRRHAQI